ncbi:MAG: ATP-binding protein [Succiniclasticum sp.]|jgi:signal transduction histidine kinase
MQSGRGTAWIRSLRSLFGRQRIAARLIKYFGLALLVSAGVMTLLFSHFFEENYVGRTQLQMYRRALQIADFVKMDNLRPVKEGNTWQQLDSRQQFMRKVAALTDEDIWIVMADGRVEMYGHIPPPAEERNKVRKAAGRMGQGLQEEMDFVQSQWARRRPLGFTPTEFRNTTIDKLPENVRDIAQAGLRGETIMTERENDRSWDVVSYVTAPVTLSDGRTAGVVILRQPVFGYRRALHDMELIYAFCLVVAIALAFAVSVALALKFSRPLHRMRNVTVQMATGNFHVRSGIHRNDEIGELAQSLDHMAEMLEKAKREREHMEQSRKIFISNISHELRTPVTVVRGSLEALRDKVVTDPDEVARYYESMYNEVLFQQRLINDLLELSRLQNPEFSIDKQPLNFVTVLQEAVRNARHLGRLKQIKVTAEFDRELYRMSGDYGRLVQMLLVFLDNSVKFSPEGGSIEVTLQGRTVTITDHGSGISKEDMEHIFERFYHSLDAANKNGTGLGLTIARSICERHNIHVGVTSEEGKGTTVTLTLPEPEADGSGDTRA